MVLRRFLHIIFFGNYFYGCCAVALAIESNLQLGVPLNHWLFYAALFCGTTAFYNYSYSYDPAPSIGNQRAIWIAAHIKTLRWSQLVLMVLTLISGVSYLWVTHWRVGEIPFWQLLVLLIFPIVAILYYGISFPGIFHLNLRSNGWFKPFVIGFVWAGIVSVMPVFLAANEGETAVSLNFYFFWFFLKNWMFITVLCIMFDIKDYAADHNHDLKTFVVRVGLRKTIYTIIIPLVLAGLASYFVFVSLNDFSTGRVLANLVPFLLLLRVVRSMHQRRPILYYLLVIDGLMLVKAACGTFGVLIFS